MGRKPKCHCQRKHSFDVDISDDESCKSKTESKKCGCNNNIKIKINNKSDHEKHHEKHHDPPIDPCTATVQGSLINIATPPPEPSPSQVSATATGTFSCKNNQIIFTGTISIPNPCGGFVTLNLTNPITFTPGCSAFSISFFPSLSPPTISFDCPGVHFTGTAFVSNPFPDSIGLLLCSNRVPCILKLFILQFLYCPNSI